MLSDAAVRVLTVTGPGGIGKTRLALQAAAESSAAFPDGLWWVALSPLRDPALVLAALGQALDVREEEGIDLPRATAARLAGRRMLILSTTPSISFLASWTWWSAWLSPRSD